MSSGSAPEGRPDEDFTMEADVVVSADSAYKTCRIRDKHELFSDEPAFLPHGAGHDDHPWPVDYMNLALVTCQVAVLSQCLEKAQVETFTVKGKGIIDDFFEEDVPDDMPVSTRTRIGHISVQLTVEVPDKYESRANRCLDVYDEGCIVGQSYRSGIQYTPDTQVVVSN